MTPTEELMMEVLAARWRCGETVWTFPSHMRNIATRLEAQGLVGWKSGIVEKTIMVWFTDAGREQMLSATYVAPIVDKTRQTVAEAIAEWAYGSTDVHPVDAIAIARSGKR